MSLQTDVNTFMKEYYGELPLYYNQDNKIINMSRLGTNVFFKHEMAIIDTPIVQRLKYISQLGPAYNVFPTARHTRFEHSLGVTILVNKMWNSLDERGIIDFLDAKQKKEILYNLRISALLHDIGHCPFSHVSEMVLMDFPSIRSENLSLKSNPHEIIGYYMLKSDVLKSYFDSLSKKYGVLINIDEASKYIIRKASAPNDQYIAELINGPFDADKLDYIPRDSEYSGVPLALGIDRLLASIGIERNMATEDGNANKLIVTEKGIMPLEQILLAKVMLYSSIYHHQKVRAIDQMIISILRLIIEEEIPINGNPIKSPMDLLKLEDFDILRLSDGSPQLKNLCKQLKLRQTLKRCLVISPKTKEKNSDAQFWEMIQLSNYPNEVRRLNQVLAQRIGNGCTEFDVAIDIPQPPKLGEAQQRIIRVGKEFKTMKDIFPQQEWLNAYVSNKWKGHVFSIDKYRKKACEEGKILFKERFGIVLNKFAEEDAKILPLYA